MSLIKGWPGALAARALATVAATVILACASGGGRSQSDLPVTIVVQNNLAVPAQLTLYIASGSGARQLLGDVQSASTTAFQFTPSSRTETYRLVARRVLAREIRSQPFIVGSTMTGRIVWTLVPNIIGFEEVDSDSTGSD